MKKIDNVSQSNSEIISVNPIDRNQHRHTYKNPFLYPKQISHQVDEKTNELYARIFDIGAKKEEANIEGEGTESLPIRQNVQKEKQSEIRFPKSKGENRLLIWECDIPSPLT